MTHGHGTRPAATHGLPLRGEEPGPGAAISLARRSGRLLCRDALGLLNLPSAPHVPPFRPSLSACSLTLPGQAGPAMAVGSPC